MKVKNANLEFYAFYIDFNSKKVKRINILQNLEVEIAKRIRSQNKNLKIKNRDDLKKFLRSKFLYHYWSKCEMEYAIGDLFICEGKNVTVDSIRENLIKLDVWYQIEPNLDVITDYVIDKMNLTFRRGNESRIN